MARSKSANTVLSLIKEPIESLGYTLWDVRFLKEGASWYLRVFIDKEDGITIDDCTEVSHLIDPIIDKADPIDRAYYLEVCSTGLERELTEPEHFSKMMGKKVTVKLIRPRENRREFKGMLSGFDGGVTITDGEEKTFFEKAEISSVRLADLED